MESYNALVLLKMKEVYCAANRKNWASQTHSWKLIKILLTENIDVSDVIKLKRNA
jgi:hypothetical protein